jgi:hypothetical protein
LKTWYEEQKTKPYYLQLGSDKMIANIITYAKAFPDRKVAGKKRGRE